MIGDHNRKRQTTAGYGFAETSAGYGFAEMATEYGDAETSAYINAVFPVAHLMLTAHRNTSGERMTLRDRPWLYSLLQDRSEKVVVAKCAQVGLTETMICIMFHLGSTGHRGMYLLPTDAWRSVFVGDRVDKLLDRCPVYADMVKKTGKEVDAKTYKSICGMGWRFAGTANPRKEVQPRAAFEFPADVLFIDEYDLHDPGSLVYFMDRTVRSKRRRLFMYGNPTVAGRGIWPELERSDNKRWMVQCPDCGHPQEMSFEGHFIERDGDWWRRRPTWPNPQCEKCGRAFNRLGSGKWVATNLGSEVSGYRVSRLFTSIRPNDMDLLWEMFVAARWDPTRMQNLRNNYLCEPYEASGFKLSEEDLRRAAVPYDLRPVADKIRKAHLPMWAGIDQGKAFHVVVCGAWNGKEYVLDAFHMRDSFDELGERLAELGVDYAVVDAGGGGYGATRDFVAGGEGRLMCRYVPADRVKAPYAVDEAAGVVEANRTESIDAVAADVKSRRTALPPDWKDLDGGDFVRHLTWPNRVIDSRGRPIWTSGEDHLLHAMVYARLAREAFQLSDAGSEVAAESWRV